ncbi:heparan-sulfate 6-O-sulfotransferase 1-A [Latimeria chalumnae]|uniref:Heparan-sulfate 6-O-sulfotransferase n=1 Tax=Latimeria chalumnae TaxID=7897 RepID=H3B6M2_LATCH|nr:PREDICTED: heparan-sulfate 6-O-sulfotransferase 1 [Latimeria chalumnae]|eukprot:XP_005995567.1 PREDICTED: heparan-sulfate 6-O-sulfotransferase 1 [Latimeria chalumnae]
MKRAGKIMGERAGRFALILAGSVCFMLILYQYVGPGVKLGVPGRYYPETEPEPADLFPTPDPHYVKKYYFPVRDLDRSVPFDMKGEDVIVFLHIQKTGGTTFGRHLVQNVRLEVPCDCRPGQKKCTCYRPNRRETWLFSRFSTGWSCGLHADWTELTNCVPGVLDKKESSDGGGGSSKNRRKFYYITLLRDPVSRYLSEWRHVQRGATWKTSLHMCDGRTPTPEELPSCYEGMDWSGCTLQQFMDCPYNLANNRQVRMLADLSLVGCYNMSFIPEKKRAQVLLESAKKNLKDMAFFGLTEFQRKTQFLFERTFNLKFIRPFMQYNSTRAGGVEVDNDTIQQIEELNDLDMQLYDYAKDLFQQRYQYIRQLERMEQRIKNKEEKRLHRSNEPFPKEETEDQGRLPTEDYMSHIIEKW